MHGDDVALAGGTGEEEVGDAEAFAAVLTWEGEAFGLAVVVFGVVDDEVVAVGVAGEVAVDDGGLEDVLVAAGLLEAFEEGRDLLVELAFVVGVAHGALLELPLASEECDGVDEGIDEIEADVLDEA